jgi:hypothetical protein
MWLLVLFSAVVNASPGGGASHVMTTVPFATEAECTAAKTVWRWAARPPQQSQATATSFSS